MGTEDSAPEGFIVWNRKFCFREVERYLADPWREPLGCHSKDEALAGPSLSGTIKPLRLASYGNTYSSRLP